ncbi:MAG: hypothetical protein CMQ46_03170 [Gammaproteobacteria bacterium]|nr:hypothetical protein [Gammaproteobacteria bacterium]MBJ54248.1 hypothetical protein [Gammaproteobacteria bacterium]
MSSKSSDISFLQAAELLQDALLVVASDGLILGANRAARRLLTNSRQSIDGQSLLAFAHGAEADVLKLLRDGSRTRERLPGVLVLKSENGQPLRVRSAIHLLTPATEEKPAQLVLQLRDADSAPTKFKELSDRVTKVTAALHRQQRAEEERRELEAQMLQSQKLESLGVMAGGIAHDFNNLLTSIIGYSELARAQLPEHSAAGEFVDAAVTGARRAAELTQQMLAYSGKGSRIVEPVQLSRLVKDITRLLEVSISKKCVMRFELPEDLPACMADATQLRQVIMNLIINASDAIGDRSGVISITTGAAWCDRDYLDENFINDTLEEGLYVHMEVADTGKGMSADVRARIFDPFFTTKFTGRGLGLAAVLGVIRGHKGAIRVYSEPGRGTTFKVLLPAAPGVEPQAVKSDSEPEQWQGFGTALVIDDEESIRALARHMLMRMGFEVATASDGREGVEVYREMAASNPLVLLDLTMPHLDGAAAFAQLRRINPKVRVIVMSGYGEQTIDTQFAGKGLAGFLQKPFRLAELRDVVKAAVEP